MIVYFYPGHDARLHQAGLRLHRVTRLTASAWIYTVIGISPDKPEKLAKFRERDHLTITLLSDPDKSVMKSGAPSARRCSTARR